MDNGNETRRKRVEMDRQRQSTHWADCWRDAGHHACAVAQVEELQKQLNKVADNISDLPRLAEYRARAETAEAERDALRVEAVAEIHGFDMDEWVYRHWLEMQLEAGAFVNPQVVRDHLAKLDKLEARAEQAEAELDALRAQLAEERHTHNKELHAAAARVDSMKQQMAAVPVLAIKHLWPDIYRLNCRASDDIGEWLHSLPESVTLGEVQP